MSDDLPATGPRLRELIDKLRGEWKELAGAKKEFYDKEVELLQRFLQAMEKYYETYFDLLMGRGNPPDYFYQIADDMIQVRNRLKQLGALDSPDIDKKKKFKDPDVENSLTKRIQADKERKRAQFFKQEHE